MTTTLTLFAQSTGSAGFNPLIMMGLVMVIMWVLMIRPQQKRAKALKERQSNLKKGDNVVTIGGMHASVNAVSDGTVSLRVSEGVFVKYDRTAIARIIDKDVIPSAKVSK